MNCGKLLKSKKTIKYGSSPSRLAPDGVTTDRLPNDGEKNWLSVAGLSLRNRRPFHSHSLPAESHFELRLFKVPLRPRHRCGSALQISVVRCGQNSGYFFVGRANWFLAMLSAERLILVATWRCLVRHSSQRIEPQGTRLAVQSEAISTRHRARWRIANIRMIQSAGSSLMKRKLMASFAPWP